jgi:hypothetical protein
MFSLSCSEKDHKITHAAQEITHQESGRIPDEKFLPAEASWTDSTKNMEPSQTGECPVETTKFRN